MSDLMGICQNCGAPCSYLAKWCVSCRKIMKRLSVRVANSRRRKLCEYPGCDQLKRPNGTRYCNEHANPEGRHEYKSKRDIHAVPLWSPCDKCSSLVVCRAEINRPSFSPPCFADSKFFDRQIAQRAGRGNYKEIIL